MDTNKRTQNAQNQKNTTDWLTEKQTRRLAFLYQAMFIGVLADIRAEEFIEIVETTPEYRSNYKNVRKYVKQLQRAIHWYEYQQFQGYVVGEFDHSAFYDWAVHQKALTIISEYSMPEPDFVAVAAIKISVQMQGGSGTQATEKLFVPKHQYDEYKRRIGWLF